MVSDEDDYLGELEMEGEVEGEKREWEMERKLVGWLICIYIR